MEFGSLWVYFCLGSGFWWNYIETCLRELEEWWNLNSEIRILWLKVSESMIDWREQWHHIDVILTLDTLVKHNVNLDISLLHTIWWCWGINIVRDISECHELDKDVYLLSWPKQYISIFLDHIIPCWSLYLASLDPMFKFECRGNHLNLLMFSCHWVWILNSHFINLSNSVCVLNRNRHEWNLSRNNMNKGWICQLTSKNRVDNHILSRLTDHFNFSKWLELHPIWLLRVIKVVCSTIVSHCHFSDPVSSQLFSQVLVSPWGSELRICQLVHHGFGIIITLVRLTKRWVWNSVCESSLRLSDFILVHWLWNNNLSSWLALGRLLSWLAHFDNSNLRLEIILTHLLVRHLLTLIWHENMKSTVVLICLWIVDLALLASWNLCHSLPTELEEGNFARAKVESSLSIKNINCQITLFKILSKFDVLIIDLTHWRINIERNLNNAIIPSSHLFFIIILPWHRFL